METWVVHERLFSDPELTAHGDVGIVLYLRFFQVCESNWGHCAFKSRAALLMSIYPDEAEAVMSGDEAMRARWDAIRSALDHLVETGHIIEEQTCDGTVFGLRSWEKHTGHQRRNRGWPKHPMGPRLAACRDWSKLHPNALRGTHEWADRYGITDNIAYRGTPSSTTSRTTVQEVPELGRPNRRQEARGKIQEARGQEPEASRVDASDEPAAADSQRDSNMPELPPEPSPDAARLFAPITIEVCQLAGVSPDDAGGTYHVDQAITLMAPDSADVKSDAVEYASWCRDRCAKPTHHGLVKSLQKAHELRKHRAREPARNGKRHRTAPTPHEEFATKPREELLGRWREAPAPTQETGSPASETA